MGKHKHHRDKLYLNVSELARDWGGYKGTGSAPFRSLPFNACGVTLRVFSPASCVVGVEGSHILFEKEALVDFVRTYEKHPITGEKTKLEELNVFKVLITYSADKPICPITLKTLTPHSELMLNTQSGYLYSEEAINNLCKKTKRWQDPITDVKCKNSNFVTIQSDKIAHLKNIQNFYHQTEGIDSQLPSKKHKTLPSTQTSSTHNSSDAKTRGGGNESTEGEIASKGANKNVKNVQNIEKKHQKIAKNHEENAKNDQPMAQNDNKIAKNDQQSDTNRHEVTKNESQISKQSIQTTPMMERILQKTKTQSEFLAKHKQVVNPPSQPPTSSRNQKHTLYTTHRQAASLTSTVVNKSTETEFRHMTDSEVRQLTYDRVREQKLKGYIGLETNMGILNIELHCDIAPMACDNFLRHSASGYYNGTIFFRSIANFMIQGGDPVRRHMGRLGGKSEGSSEENVEKKGEKKGEKKWENSEKIGQNGRKYREVSAFEGGSKFKDEFDNRLIHKNAGVVSMANQGPHTNLSQFYITYKSCMHLNNKHTVFAHVVGGLDILKKMEALPCVDTKPKDPPYVRKCIVYTNPFEESKEEDLSPNEPEEPKDVRRWFISSVDALHPHRADSRRSSQAVGKYLSK